MEIKKQAPPIHGKPTTDAGEFLTTLVEAAWESRGEWVSAEKPQFVSTNSIGGAVMTGRIARHFAEWTQKQGTVYIRIKTEEEL